MNWIRVIQICLFLTGVILLLFSWEYKNFVSLLFVGAIFSALIASIYSKSQVILVPLTAIFVTVSFAEIALPFVSSVTRSLTYFEKGSGYGSEGYYERIKGFGYRPRPGVYTSRKLSYEGEEIYDVVYTIGKDGYRNDIQNTDYTVYIYGCSFTFGLGLNDNETLSYYLFQNHGISSKNLGIHGYGLHQALYNIEQGLVTQRENIVNALLTSPWHALRSSCKPSHSGGTPQYQITSKGLQLLGTCSGGDIISRVFNKSNVVSLINSFFQDKNIITDSDINLYLEIIKEISRLSEKNNSELIIFYIDATSKELENTSWSNESIISELSKFSTVIDVTLAEKYEELDARFYIHELDKHPSALANKHRAKIIASQLQN